MKRLVPALLLSIAFSAWSANLCSVQRVEVREPQDPHGVWELIIASEMPPPTIVRKEGSTEDAVDQEYQFNLELKRFLKQQSASAPPAWPPRFTLREGDVAHQFMHAHSSCKLAAKVVDGLLTLEVTAAGCDFGKCSSSTQLIAPVSSTP